MLAAVAQGPISSNSRFVLITPRPDESQILAETIARDSVRNESLLIQRLLIQECSPETLNDVFTVASSLDSGENNNG